MPRNGNLAATQALLRDRLVNVDPGEASKDRLWRLHLILLVRGILVMVLASASCYYGVFRAYVVRVRVQLRRRRAHEICRRLAAKYYLRRKAHGSVRTGNITTLSLLITEDESSVGWRGTTGALFSIPSLLILLFFFISLPVSGHPAISS